MLQHNTWVHKDGTQANVKHIQDISCGIRESQKKSLTVRIAMGHYLQQFSFKKVKLN